MKVKKKYLALMLFNLIALCMIRAFSLEFTFGLAIVLWVDLLLFCWFDLENRGIFLGFLLCFFVFLMGRQTLEYFRLHEVEIYFPKSIEVQANRLLLLSLIGLFVGYVFLGSIRLKKKTYEIESVKSEGKARTYRQISKYFYYLTFPLALLTLLESARFVQSQGYYASYVDYQSRLPSVVLRLSSMNGVFFFVYLACLPGKRESRFPIILRVVYLGLTLFTGHRYNCIGGLLILVVYFMLRNKQEIDSKWFDRKKMFVVAVGAVAIMILSNVVSVTRLGGKAAVNVSSSITDFFYQQGVSISVVKRYLEYNAYLPKGKLYFLGSTLSGISRSLPGRLIFGMKAYGGNSIDTARNGYYLAHALSYVVLGDQYLSGGGTGSSYIAEIHYSFGYLGVLLGNVFYGVLLRKLFVLREGRVWRNAVVLLMLNALFFASRGEFDGWIGDLLNTNTWGAMLMVFVTAQLVRAVNRARRHREEASREPAL